jgi:hypothetical protein
MKAGDSDVQLVVSRCIETRVTRAEPDGDSGLHTL